MKNAYEIRGEVTAIFIHSPKYGDLETLIDTVDLPRANETSGIWYAGYSKITKSFYVQSSININGKKTKRSFTQWLFNKPDLFIDHINHDTLDNRRSCNLRTATRSQNQHNRKYLPKNNTSGIMGVMWSSRNQKWMCRLRINKKLIHIGLYSDINDARVAIEEARAKYMSYSQEALLI